MGQLRGRAACIAAVVLICCIIPVSAVILEVTCKGTVATVNTASGSLTIKNPLQYGCDYPVAGAPICTWKPGQDSSLTGTVPDPAAFSVFIGGEPVVATSLGSGGGTWITLAKIYGQRESEQMVTDIVGDPRTVPLPLIGNYAVDIQMVPDCAACTGTVCTAKQAEAVIRSGGSVVSERTLEPGGEFSYNGRNDGSSVSVKYVSGQAAAGSCPGKAGMAGPQPISVFVIRVIPPAGYGQVDIRTATTTRPEEALTPLPRARAATETAPTKSGFLLPLTALVGLGAGALLSSKR